MTSRRLFALAFALVFAGLPVEARDLRQIVVATDGAYLPFSGVDKDGQPYGYDVDVARAVCDRIGATCKVVAAGWEGIMPMLANRKADFVVASVPITETTRRQVELTRAYHRILPRFIARMPSDVGDPAKETLAGVKVGVRGGTSHAAHMVSAHPGAVVVSFASEAEAGRALIEGRVDLVFGDTLALYAFLDASAPRNRAGFVGSEVSDPVQFGEGAGIAFRREDRELASVVDRALVDMGRDGTLDRIAGRWFPFAIR